MRDEAMILVAVGANLAGPHGEHPQVSVRAAITALGDLPGLRLVAASRLYATAPVPASDQPPYVNAVARLAGQADPAWLLGRLLAIEAQGGRTRSTPDAARTLDLDLIAMGGLVRAAPDPILPHPRAHQRAFVLVPLRDVAPGWVHPVLGRPLAELIAALPPQGLELL